MKKSMVPRAELMLSGSLAHERRTGAADTARPEELHRRLKLLLGVLETGLFLEEAELALVGSADGSVQERRRPQGS